MSAFIVISSSNRLHYLVDGIERCRPLNPNVFTKISTGKIIKSESDYKYKYNIYDAGHECDEAKSFTELLSNQLAAFRTAYNIGNKLVNIFFLMDPQSQNDIDETEQWLKAFDEVYEKSDQNFCLFQIVFTYNCETPTNVSGQIEITALQRLIDQHKSSIKKVIASCSRFLFYMDNQKADHSALCLGKNEHDFKMPRFLLDFMMLASNDADKYQIISAICPPTVNTRCFSVGYAESMYYYPDVERYYIHADNRDIVKRLLTSDDEVELSDVGKSAMDIEGHPFGLQKRRERLKAIYDDISFVENIKSYSTTADYKIDRSIIALRDLLMKEREKEFEDFEKSAEVYAIKNSIKDLEEKIAIAVTNEEEINQLKAEKEQKEFELEHLRRNFTPDCPEYIDRCLIYNELHATEEDDRDASEKSLTRQYWALVNFAKTKKFYDFVEAEKIEQTDPDAQPPVIDNEEPGKGCMFSLIPWRKGSKKADHTNSVITPDKISDSTADIKIIRTQLDLKREFVKFKENVSAVEDKYKEEKEYCANFKLTTHSNHYCPLIDIHKLKIQQETSSSARLEKGISKWETCETREKSVLLNVVKEQAIKQAKVFSFIEWGNPFPFIRDLTSEEILVQICNELQKRAIPMVNYNIMTSTSINVVSRKLYSDIPDFRNKIDHIKTKLDDGSQIIAYESSHIASKICMFQFLPMDDEIINNLTDLKGQHNDSQNSSEDNLIDYNEEIDSQDSEFWGDH